MSQKFTTDKTDLKKIGGTDVAVGEGVSDDGTQRVTLASDSTGGVSVNADVLEIDGDADYSEGDTGKRLTQTPDGRLRVAIAGIVQDAVESYVNGATKSLSLNSEGRLRVVSQSESYNFESWGDPEKFGTNMNCGTLTAW